MMTPTCPNCDAEIPTDFGFEADEYPLDCPECGHPLVVFRSVHVEHFAATDVAKLRMRRDPDPAMLGG